MNREPRVYYTRARSIAKSISWRVLGSIDTFVLGSLISHQAKIGAIIAGSEVLTKLFLYYLHERGWAHVRWGALGRSLVTASAPTSRVEGAR